MFKEEIVATGVKNQYQQLITIQEEIVAKHIQKTVQKIRQILTKFVKIIVKNLFKKEVHFLWNFRSNFGRSGDPKSTNKVK